MKFKTLKEALNNTNKIYKDNLIKYYINYRQPLIDKIYDLYNGYNSLDNLNKYFKIHDYMYQLSFYNDDEVIQILKKFELKTFTPKLFVDYTHFFDAIKQHENSTTLLFPYELIIGVYDEYSRLIVKEAIVKDLNIDLTKIAVKTNRQYKAGNTPDLLNDKIEELKKLKHLLEDEEIYMPFKENNPFTSIVHAFKFTHKNSFRNLYYLIHELNSQTNILTRESDLKVEFFDLLKCILRDKSILNDNDDAQLNYGEPGNSRFKIKRVESLILR